MLSEVQDEVVALPPSKPVRQLDMNDDGDVAHTVETSSCARISVCGEHVLTLRDVAPKGTSTLRTVVP
jgi:hypothetical protein